jgi:hypothetical protein
MNLTSPRIAGIATLLVWGASLALPVLTACGPGYDHAPGVFVLAIGWLGLLEFQPAWIANVLMVIVAIMLLARQRAPVWLGIVTALIAACGLYLPAIYDDRGEVPICHYHVGYYLWFVAAGVALIGTFLSRPLQPARA